MFSEAAEEREERRAALEREREDVAMSLEGAKERVAKYARVQARSGTKVMKGDRQLCSELKRSDSEAEQASKKAARMELLLQEEPGFLEAEGMERTQQFRQEQIAAAAPLATSTQYFDLRLDALGPYSISYSRHGRQLLIAGRKGHLASMDWKDKKLGCEFHVREAVRDVQFLHNEMLFAVAQKRYLYIYDHTGMELHCLKNPSHVNRLTFLPYHFLLASATDQGNLHYLDSSMGRSVVEHRTKMGALKTMTHNPYNAIVHLGHHNGSVTLWSPNVSSALVRVQCHRGPVTAMAVDQAGRCMVTAGLDARLKVWDLRGYGLLHEVHCGRPVGCLALSQRGLLAAGTGPEVEVWQDALRQRPGLPYLRHRVSGGVADLQFVPYEDCLGIGHERGFTSIIVPGAAEANFDALEANPYQSKRQRRETEVKQLLEKIPAELITLEPDQLARVDEGKEESDVSEKEAERKAHQQHRGRGKERPDARALHKQRLKEEAGKKLLKVLKKKGEGEGEGPKKASHVLDRFR